MPLEAEFGFFNQGIHLNFVHRYRSKPGAKRVGQVSGGRHIAKVIKRDRRPAGQCRAFRDDTPQQLSAAQVTQVTQVGVRQQQRRSGLVQIAQPVDIRRCCG